MLRAFLVFASALGFFSLIAPAQPIALPNDKKADISKGKDDAAKSKTAEKTETDKAKTPPAMSLESFLELQERIKALERQLKVDKKVPFSCKLGNGKLEGDFLVFRVEYAFSTEAPKTSVLLGLKGSHLLDEGDLDGQTPILDYTDEGFVALIDKEGKEHRLTLNIRVPVLKGGVDRTVEVGVPGAPVTLVGLELPSHIKELRWNETLEKSATPGRWQFGLDKSSKTLTLAWKEPLSLSGNARLPKVEGQIQADVHPAHVKLSAELFLEDSRRQTKEWHLLLPAQAEVVVKAPTGLTAELLKPEGNVLSYTLKVPPTAERWQVSVSLQVPRPANLGASVPVGPFHVLGAFQQYGTITVKMPTEASLGQRLVFIPTAGVDQLKNAETESVFRYVSDKNVKGPPTKALLELKWRFDKNQLETQLEHVLKVRAVNQGWEIDATTQIHVKAIFSAINAVDLKLPQPRPRGVSVIGSAAPGIAFPGSLPWAGMWKTFGLPWTYASPDEFSVFDDLGKPLNMLPQDTTGKTRVSLERTTLPKKMTIVLKNSFRIPGQNPRIRLELPRPLNTQDRGAKLSIQSEDRRIELLHGPQGAEEPVPDQHHFEMSWDQAPSYVDLAWRPYHRRIVAQSTLDVTLHEHTAQVKQTLRFPRDQTAAGDTKFGQVTLKLPPGIDKAPELSGGKIINLNLARHTLLLRPDADAEKVDLVLQYDLDIADAGLLGVSPIWPASAFEMDAKVRVWSAAGARVALTEDLVQRGLWKERSIEIVPDREQFPALVLQGFGTSLPLTLKIEKSASPALAAFQADRALLQVRTLDDGSQQCRARYLIRKIHAPHLDVELPLALSHFHVKPSFSIGKYLTDARPTDATEKIVRVRLHPDQVVLPAVLEINYTIPGDGGNSFWRTKLQAPMFVSKVVIAHMRWQLTTPTPMIAASLGRNVRGDVQWGWQSWLRTPEVSVPSAEAEAWATDKEPAPSAWGVTYSFTHVSLQPETVYHLPRWGWLLGCSGLLLIVTLGGYFSPLPRVAFWLLLLVLALAVLTLSNLIPAAMPALLFGAQPGVGLFLVFIGIHKLLQERYRRQLVFLPGFSRAKPGSTMVRTNSAARPREASTVDAPPPAESSAAKPGGSQA